MKIVIEIGNEHYERIMRFEEDVTVYPTTLALYEAVKNGAPLPKGHGRLIDYECVVDAIDDWINTGEYSYTNATDYLRKRVKSAPTIIEGSDAE